jgi:FOG: CheY-like receiver
MEGKILIIEDNKTKLERLKDFCVNNYSGMDIVEVVSYKYAQQEVVHRGNDYDIILLDVSMPNYDQKEEENGGQPKPLAGMSILRYMLLAGVDTKVIVVTMYENFVDGVKIKQLDSNFKKQYPDIYEGYVYYSHKNNDWKKSLKKLMDNVL